MSVALLLAEPWEGVFAIATAKAVADRLGALAVLAPAFLRPHLNAIAAVTVEYVDLPAGYPTLESVTEILVAAAARQAHWQLPAGALPLPGPGKGAPIALSAPIHRPPEPRAHCVETRGKVDVWRLDTGESYFDALAALPRPFEEPPQWSQYGPMAAVFAVNTSPFLPVVAGRADRYVILGSGLIGLRAVAESDPCDGAEVIVYDINPRQLDWVRHVLDNVSSIDNLDDMIATFSSAHPGAWVRPIAPHEEANAALQRHWYARSRGRLSEISTRLTWRMVQVDIWSHPEPLFDLLSRPVGHTFFLYLDLFQVWDVAGATPWIADMPDLARSLERAVRTHAGGEVAFFPTDPEGQVVLNPDNPLGRSAR